MNNDWRPGLLGFDPYTYRPQSAAAMDFAEQTGGLFGPVTPEARAAEAEFSRRLMEDGGVRALALSDPAAFSAAYPNVIIGNFGGGCLDGAF